MTSHRREDTNTIICFPCFMLFAIVFLLTHWPGILAKSCGRPGRTSLSFYKPQGDSFNVGARIRYNCIDEKDLLIGSVERFCLNNGTWSGDIPVCSKRIRIEEATMPNENVNMDVRLSIDGNISTCTALPNLTETAWDAFVLSSKNISTVQIYLQGKPPLNVEVTIKGDSKPDSTCWNLYNTSGNLKTATLTFHCAAGAFGKYIYVRNNFQALKICEVYVFLQPVQQCLSPDVPSHGYGHAIHYSSKTEYRFICKDGYKRWGHFIAVCQPNGTWIPKSPICEKVYCSVPLKLENGFVNYEMVNGAIPFNGTAEYSCSQGFYLDGHSKIRCHRWETWDFSPPKCRRNLTEIHCENFTSFESNGKWIELNDSHLIRMLACSDGFNIEGYPPISRCLFNGSWSSTSATCKNALEDGDWKKSWTPSLILITAVGASTAISILCMSVVFLAVRKKYQAQKNRTIFHIEDFINTDKRDEQYLNRKKCQSSEHYETVIELRTHTHGINSRKPHSALPNLPVEADPVYAVPFETDNAKTSILTHENKKDDLYSAHIYAEPVDFKRSTLRISNPPINIVTLRTIEANENFLHSNMHKISDIYMETNISKCDKQCPIYGSSSHSLELGNHGKN